MRRAILLRRAHFWLLGAMTLCFILLAGLGTANVPQAAGQEVSCQFVLGFATLRDVIGPDIVGECREDQRFSETGDALQATTGGLLVWRKTDNWTAFTDGTSTWILGPDGLQMRPNEDRFPWEPRPTATPRPSPTAFPFPTPTSTRVPNATPTVTPVPAALRVVTQGVGSGVGNLSESEFGYGFVVENPNNAQALDAVTYQATFFSAIGLIVGTDEGLIRRVLPGQRLGVGGRVYVVTEQPPVRVEVRLTPGGITVPAQPVELVVENVQNVASVARGTIRNRSGREAPLSIVSAVAYNSAGAVIGGGTADVPSVPANGTIAAEVPIITAVVPSRVEMFAWPATNLP